MTSEATPRRRLSADERRDEILSVAEQLFAERPFTLVSTADVAEAAGVARSLVHHYFGGIRELFLAVAARGVDGLDEVRTAGVEVPVDERIAHNLSVGLDVLAANRATWLAVVGQSGAFGDPELGALLAATNEVSIQRTIETNRDLIEDTPTTRFALRCFQALIVEASRAWLVGDVAREEAERLLVVALERFLTDVIPQLERSARGSAGAGG